MDPDTIGEITQHLFRRLHENVTHSLIKRAKLVYYFMESMHNQKHFGDLSNYCIGGDEVIIKSGQAETRLSLLSKCADNSWLAARSDGTVQVIPGSRTISGLICRGSSGDGNMAFHLIESLMQQLVEAGEFAKRELDEELFNSTYVSYAMQDRQTFIRSVEDLQDDYATVSRLLL